MASSPRLPQWEDVDKRRRLVLGCIDQLPDEYLPWRRLRFHNPPALPDSFAPLAASLADLGLPAELFGPLTVEEWWLVLRRDRNNIGRDLPTLTSTSGQPLRFALTDQVLRQAEAVASQLGGQIGFAAEVANDPNRDRYIRSALEEEAITSSQLEGAATTRRVAKEMLQTGRAPRDKSERMIANNFLAMQRARELRDVALTPGLVRELHAIVTEATLDDSADAGRLQALGEERVVVVDARDDIVVHRPPDAAELPQRLQQLCDFANELDGGPYLPGVLRALTLHFMVSYDHFFVDGNGRTARAIFYWSMLHHGYWLAEYLTISTILRKAFAQYAQSFIDTEQDGGDLTYFFLYHLDVLRRAIDGLRDYVQRTTSLQRSIRARLDPSSGEFNLRQISLLGEATRDPDRSFTATVVAARFAVTDQTARSDLDDLVARGYLTRSREGHRFVWRVSPRLPELLNST